MNQESFQHSISNLQEEEVLHTYSVNNLYLFLTKMQKKMVPDQ